MARTFVGSRNLTFDPRILVAGFSQGGKVAMALGATPCSPGLVQLGRHSHFGSAILGTDRVVSWFHRIALSDSFKTSRRGVVTM